MWNVCSLTESFLARPQIIVYKAYNDIFTSTEFFDVRFILENWQSHD